ncbi:MAG: FTR1 family protein [Candidatus Woykebacteria bacterium]
MGSSFLITLREGVEAALIVAIVLAYLRTIKRTDQFKFVYIGAVLGVLVSLLAAVIIFIFIGGLEGRAEQITEGIVSVAAAGVLTWMIFWMKKQSRTIGQDLRNRVDRALTSGVAFGVTSVVFVGVLREGIETSLFLVAVFLGSNLLTSGLGAMLGLLAAVLIGVAFYTGSKKINIKLFFQLTGAFVIIVAAGLLSKGVHEFQEAGLINFYSWTAWDLTSLPIIGEGQISEFMKSLVGWTPTPSAGQALAWTVYLTTTTLLFYSSKDFLQRLSTNKDR